jgi:hypothetical protein
MTSIHRYDYNTTWSAVAFGAVFFGGLAVLMGLFAKHTNGVISVFLIGVSAAFAGLALFALARRLWRRDVLALADDAIFYPHGFIRRTLTRIPYADIIRVTEAHLHGRSGFCMVTARGTFEIGTNLFRDKESYRAVKESICARASIAIPQSDNPEPASAVGIWTEFPEPVLCWKEPEVWSRFRTSLVAAKPWMLVRRVLGFFVCCFAILVAPWFFVGLDIRPPGCFGVSIAVTLFFTLLRWLSIKYPVHSTDIASTGAELRRISASRWPIGTTMTFPAGRWSVGSFKGKLSTFFCCRRITASWRSHYLTPLIATNWRRFLRPITFQRRRVYRHRGNRVCSRAGARWPT